MKDRDEGFLAPVRRVLRGEPRAAREIPFWMVPYKYRWRVYWDEATRDIRVFDMGAWGRPAGLRDRRDRLIRWYADPWGRTDTRPSERSDGPHTFDWMLGLCPWPLSEP